MVRSPWPKVGPSVELLRIALSLLVRFNRDGVRPSAFFSENRKACSARVPPEKGQTSHRAIIYLKNDLMGQIFHEEFNMLL